MSPNYHTDFFQFDTLTPIEGEPAFLSLLLMKNQIKANVQSVPCTLGGGQHGHLGLIMTPLEYAMVSNTPFITEPYPGALTFPAGTTALQSKVLQDAYEKRLALYNACVGVEKALLQQIIQAVEADWLAPLRNNNTNAIDANIPDILTYLFNTHGDVSPDALQEREHEVKCMTYSPASQPVVRFFAVTDLVDYASAAGVPYSRPQTLNLAYVVLKRAKVFNKAII